MRGVACCLAALAACVASESSTPASLWSTRTFSPEDGKRLSRGGLAAVLGNLVKGTRGAHVTLVAARDEERAPLESRFAASWGTPAQTHVLTGATTPAPLVALAGALSPACDVTWVSDVDKEEGGDGGEGELPWAHMSTAEYVAAVAAPPSSKRCALFALDAPSAAALDAALTPGADGSLHLTAVVAWHGRSRGDAAAAVVAAGGGRRLSAATAAALGAAAATAPTGGSNSTVPSGGGKSIMMLPAIMEGLLTGAALLFFALIGILCVCSIATPDVLHKDALPAGKEY